MYCLLTWRRRGRGPRKAKPDNCVLSVAGWCGVGTCLYPRGETSPENYAYLYDRVAAAEERPQRYGTQGMCIGSAPNLNARRKEVGLESLSEYKSVVSKMCH